MSEEPVSPDESPDESAGGTPADPKSGRQARLLVVLRTGITLVLAAATVGALAPEPWGTGAAKATAVMLVAFPVGRVAWLGVRWLRKGDTRYATVALLLLLVVATGAIAANV